MTKQQGFTIVELLVFTLIVAGAIGWVMNIIKIVQSGFDVITSMFIARCIGVFVAPLGSVLGYV